MPEEIAHAGTFSATGGLALWERRWMPAGEIRGHLVLVHGYADHCSRYAHVAEAFNEAGVAVHSFDQRGFGRSPGKPGRVDDYDLLLNDLEHFITHVRPRFDGKPFFMMGHSMGGQVLAAYYLTRRPQVRGLIFSSPFLAFPDHVPKALLAMSGLVGRLLPWAPVSKLDDNGLSRDPEVVAAAKADPLRYHGMVSARTGLQFKLTIARVMAEIATIDPPMLILHGTEDQLVSPSGTRVLAERSRSRDKTFEVVEGGCHELFNDTVKAEIIAKMTAWVRERCS